MMRNMNNDERIKAIQYEIERQIKEILEKYGNFSIYTNCAIIVGNKYRFDYKYNQILIVYNNNGISGMVNIFAIEKIDIWKAIKMRKAIKLKDGSKTLIDTNKDEFKFGFTITTNDGIETIMDVYTHTTRKKKHIDYSVISSIMYTKGNYERKTEIEIMGEW